jgi:hypothetical protein
MFIYNKKNIYIKGKLKKMAKTDKKTIKRTSLNNKFRNSEYIKNLKENEYQIVFMFKANFSEKYLNSICSNCDSQDKTKCMASKDYFDDDSIYGEDFTNILYIDVCNKHNIQEIVLDKNIVLNDMSGYFLTKDGKTIDYIIPLWKTNKKLYNTLNYTNKKRIGSSFTIGKKNLGEVFQSCTIGYDKKNEEFVSTNIVKFEINKPYIDKRYSFTKYILTPFKAKIR